MRPWEETLRVVPRGDGKTVDVFKGDRWTMSVEFPQWPPTVEQVEKLRDAMLKHIQETENGSN